MGIGYIVMVTNAQMDLVCQWILNLPAENQQEIMTQSKTRSVLNGHLGKNHPHFHHVHPTIYLPRL
jgi:hypothetical protein